jgi:signal transduction histidine kinase
MPTTTPRARVAIVDDEMDVLRSLHDLLRLEFEVLTFTDADEALAALGDREVAAVLSDQRMPRMSGVAFLARVRALCPETTRLLFTGYADQKAVIDAINEGHVYRYIAKPWEPDELLGIFRQAVDRYRLVQGRRRLVEQLERSNAELVEANRLKTAFLEIASHELNTPVAILSGLVQLWQMTPARDAPPEHRAWLERMDAATGRLRETVRRMLTLARSGDFERAVERTPTAPGWLVDQAIAAVRPFLEARRQDARPDIDPGAPPVAVDPNQVVDVLVNLLGNAIKFSPDGAAIRVGAHAEGADWVRFEVADPGVGIPEEEQKHLFEPFFTGFDTHRHSSGTHEYGRRGIGLGLPIARRFVELHGGRIDVWSEPGVGTTFRFWVPVRAAPDGPPAVVY